jgi:hypothetical protein
VLLNTAVWLLRFASSCGRPAAGDHVAHTLGSVRRCSIFAVAAVALLLGCGSSSDLTVAAAPSSTSQPAPASSAVAAPDWSTPRITGSTDMPTDPLLPAVATVDLHTGDVVRLDWLLPSAKPVLLWFWAPH